MSNNARLLSHFCFVFICSSQFLRNLRKQTRNCESCFNFFEKTHHFECYNSHIFIFSCCLHKFMENGASQNFQSLPRKVYGCFQKYYNILFFLTPFFYLCLQKISQIKTYLNYDAACHCLHNTHTHTHTQNKNEKCKGYKDTYQIMRVFN